MSRPQLAFLRGVAPKMAASLWLLRERQASDGTQQRKKESAGPCSACSVMARTAPRIHASRDFSSICSQSPAVITPLSRAKFKRRSKAARRFAIWPGDRGCMLLFCIASRLPRPTKSSTASKASFVVNRNTALAFTVLLQLSRRCWTSNPAPKSCCPGAGYSPTCGGMAASGV